MNHFIIIMHFISFTSGIVLVTLTNFIYPKYKSHVIKHALLADIFYTGLLLIDTINLYSRKNISTYNELLHTGFNLVQFAAGSAVVYYLVRVTYNLIDMEFTRVKKLISMIFIFLLVISAFYISWQPHTVIVEYITVAFRLFPYLILVYCLVILLKDIKKVNKEAKNLIYSCLAVLVTIVPWSFMANAVKGLPLFIYKIPYSPTIYFLINTIGVIFIQRHIALKQRNICNNASLSESEMYDVFSKKYGITERELEIVQHIAHGCSNPEISDKLYISPNTVKNHIYNIYRKIDIKNRYELISILSQMQKYKQNAVDVKTL